MLGGRSREMVRAEILEPENYRALARMPFVYVHPLRYMRRYFFGGGTYPSGCALRTPLGRVVPTLYSHHDVFTVNEVFCRRDYELPSHSEVIVDIGSNIGLSALYFLTRSSTVRCHLFEPDPRNVERLKRNLAGFADRYRLREKAVADQEGVVRFGRESTGRYGGVGIESEDSFEVGCLSINTVISGVLAHEPRIDLIKIDTEGMENQTVLAIDPALHPRLRVIVYETTEPVNPDRDRFELHYANQTCRLTNRLD